jgi:hypothetical protein
MKTIANTIEAPASQPRLRLQKQITIKKAKVQITRDQFEMGECSEADLQYEQLHLANLEKELAHLDAAEATDRQLTERRRVELPVLEPELKEKARRAARLGLEFQAALNEVKSVHEGIMQLADPKFPGFAVVPGVTNRDLVAACSSGIHSLVREMTGKGELFDHWLERLKAAGVEV